MKTVAFIGTGNMGSALARAVCRAIGASQVVLANRTVSKARTLAAELGCIAVSDNAQAVESARYVFLCVKPQLLPGVLTELAPVLSKCHGDGDPRMLISVAAGVRLEELARYTREAGLARIMPNTCVAIGKGMIALSAPEETQEAYLKELETILGEAGRIERIPERQMDAFSSVAGCGPAFVYPFIEALADGGVMAGLPRRQALEYAAQTVLGAAAMVLETGEHPGVLKDAVCSPGGSTIQGVAALEREGLRSAAIDAVLAAWKRNQELGK